MRTTTSRLPVSVVAQVARECTKVVATGIHITTSTEGVTSLSARFDATDGAKVIPGHQFRIELEDVGPLEADCPRLAEALDNLTAILGRYYTHRHIEHEIQRLDAHDLKQVNLRIARDAAESDLRQLVTRDINPVVDPVKK